jgi:iron complex outermembrane receptor protein
MAQRRQENLQTVPIAVTAMTAEELQVANATELRTTFLAFPSVQSVTGVAGFTVYTIRGLGGGAGGGGNIGEEPSVAVYVDGYYYTNVYSAIFGIANIDHIEVLKGPQGTLFGRNSSAGVIQIITPEPSHTPTYDASLAIENYQRFRATGYMSGPLTPTLTYSISVNVDNQGIGWGKNFTTGREANTTSNEGGRLKLMYEPNEALKNILGFDFSHIASTNGNTGAGLPGGTIGGFLKTAPGVGLYDSQQDILGLGLDVHQWGVQNTTTYDAGPVILKNLMQYRASYSDDTVDPDYGPQPLINYLLQRRDYTATEEFHVSNRPDPKLQWVAGVFYMYYDSFYPPPAGVRASGIALGPYTDIQYRSQTVNAIAGFAQATYELFPKTRFTAGYRYSAEWRTAGFFDYLTTTPGYNIPPIDYLRSSYDEHKPSWRLALDHEFGQDFMGYISYNRGFKSGSLDPNNPPGPDHPPVASEQVDSYEIGFKSEFMDHRLRLNADAFYYDFSNYQTSQLVQAPSGILLVIPVNAAGANFHGADLEFQVKPTRDLSLSLDATYVHTKFKTYENVPVYYKNAGGTGTQVIIDASGLPIPGVRKFTMTANANYAARVSGGTLTPYVQFYYTSGAYAFTDVPNGGFPAVPELALKPYAITNLGLTYQRQEVPWSVRLYVNNLSNKQAGVVTLTSLAEYQSPLLGPRTYGISFDYHFAQ